METIIRCIYPAEKNLSLESRAQRIQYLHNEISKCLNKFDWLLSRNLIDSGDEKLIKNILLDRWRKEIRKHTIIKDIPDNFIDNISSSGGFYASKKFDEDSLFRYSVGGEDEYSIYSNIIVDNYHHLKMLNQLNGIKKLITVMAEITGAEDISVSNRDMYSKLGLESDEVWFGWVAYFRKDIPLPKLPPDVLVENTKTGTLIITCEEPFNSDNPEHVRKAKELISIFREAKYTRLLEKNSVN